MKFTSYHFEFSLQVNVRILDLYEELRDGNNLLLLLELLCKTNLVCFPWYIELLTTILSYH